MIGTLVYDETIFTINQVELKEGMIFFISEAIKGPYEFGGGTYKLSIHANDGSHVMTHNNIPVDYVSVDKHGTYTIIQRVSLTGDDGWVAEKPKFN